MHRYVLRQNVLSKKIAFTWENILNRQLSESKRITRQNRKMRPQALKTRPELLGRPFVAAPVKEQNA